MGSGVKEIHPFRYGVRGEPDAGHSDGDREAIGHGVRLDADTDGRDATVPASRASFGHGLRARMPVWSTRRPPRPWAVRLFRRSGSTRRSVSLPTTSPLLLIAIGELDVESLDVNTFIDEQFIPGANDWDRAQVEADMQAWADANM